MQHRAEGIVIRTTEYGEGNKIVTLFTRQLGKIGLMARGAKKLNNRLAAVTQLFTYGDFVFFKSGGGLGNLSSGEPIAARRKIREDLHLMAYASYIAELFDKLVGDQERSEMLFEQLKAAFEALEAGKDPYVIIHIMELKLLAIGGYSPHLESCVSCGASELEMSLSVALGGLVCPACKSRDPNAVLLFETTRKLLVLFQKMDLRRLGTTDVKPNTKAQLKHCMRAFFDTYVDVRLKSRSFLDQLDKYDWT